MDNQNKKPLSLYAMWLEAHKTNALPAEWRQAHNFLTWATANGYKTEYGYKEEFTPENLILAISEAMATEPPPDPVSELVSNNTLAMLKEMAKDIDLGKASRKEDIARLIVAAQCKLEVDNDAGE